MNDEDLLKTTVGFIILDFTNIWIDLLLSNRL